MSLDRKTPLKRGKPLAKKAAKPKRTTTPRCSKQRCGKREEMFGLCISHADDEAWRLFSLWVRGRDMGCTAAQHGTLAHVACFGNLQAAHVVGRDCKTLKFDPRNVHALCEAHHRLVDGGGREGWKREWSETILGTATWDQLYVDSRTTTDRREVVYATLAWLLQEPT